MAVAPPIVTQSLAAGSGKGSPPCPKRASTMAAVASTRLRSTIHPAICWRPLKPWQPQSMVVRPRPRFTAMPTA